MPSMTHIIAVCSTQLLLHRCLVRIAIRMRKFPKNYNSEIITTIIVVIKIKLDYYLRGTNGRHSSAVIKYECTLAAWCNIDNFLRRTPFNNSSPEPLRNSIY